MAVQTSWGGQVMQLRRHSILGVAFFAAFLLVCGVALAAKTFPDRVGDVKAGTGPDIVAVKLSNTESTITFGIRFTSAPPLRVSTKEGWIDMLLIGVDVPPLGPRPVAPGGEWLGADFAMGTHGPSKTGLFVRQGPGSPAEPRKPVRFKITTSGSTLTFSITRRALGNPSWFTFSVAATRETTGGSVDLAPARGTLRYTLTG